MAEPIVMDPSQWTWPEEVRERMRLLEQPKPEEPAPELALTVVWDPSTGSYVSVPRKP